MKGKLDISILPRRHHFRSMLIADPYFSRRADHMGRDPTERTAPDLFPTATATPIPLQGQLYGFHRCQLMRLPVAIENKHDPNPAVRVAITVDNQGFTVAHHMANGVTYIRGEQYAVDALQIAKDDPNLAIWIGRRRNDLDVVMVGYLQYVPDATGDKWHYWEVVANRAKPWTIDHPELVSSCWGSQETY